ncbi:hybrid sensor histidine kinase/response regulator [Segetibacter koreensis]|uniref:hybrid sensor histidine kinase/response regulator n=1 Tax=Segetibacter koreensis TaxID=398037 RepID=UPI0003647A65|nr:ATP-binding protein [Segetibacter koreensis]
MERHARFVETMKGKIIIVLALIFISLGAMWAVNRLAFQKITLIVKELAMPNEKLSISRKLFINVSRLPHLQQTEVIKGKEKPSLAFIKQTKEISGNIASLRQFLLDEPLQLSRLDSITSLLRSDNKLFCDYLKLRYQIEQKKVYERQLHALSEQIDSPKVLVDSNVVTSEKKTTTTTIIPSDTVVTQQKKQSWINKIFGKPKDEAIVIPKQPQVIIEEEIKSRVDTLSIAKSDTSIASIGTSLRKIESWRIQRLNRLIESEGDLLKANNVLIHKLLNNLNEVETQEMEQVKEKTASTVILARETISRTRLITILFIIIALVFGILILIDVTRSRRYRKELEAAKSEAEYHSMSKQRFLTNMSHEIRTPLQSIIGYAEQQLHQEKQYDENVRAIYNSSQHLLQIVNEVLDYSRITSGKFSIESKTFSLGKVITEVVSGLQLLAGRKSLKLELLGTNLSSLPYIKGDPFRLKQVLFNLLGNAIKFTEEGSVKLSVVATNKGSRLTCSFVVEDTGIGMNEEEIKYIFNQFEQVNKNSFKGQNGTGLGLSIVKELVEAQQGTIKVESQPGKGSRFEVIVPFEYANELPVDETNSLPFNPSSFKGKVWLVDDDELILRLSSIILDKYNIKHTCFNTAEKLLDEPWDNDVKVVFADMRLPGINGAELCVLLRKKIPASTRIIALTAQVLPQEKASILKNGFNDLLLKPFNEAELITVLQEKPDTKVLPGTLNLERLAQMVGDRQQVNSILKQCHNDTTSDIEELSVAVQKNNLEKTSLIIHRLAGRVGQVGEKKLATQLRRSEAAIRRNCQVESLKDEIDDIFSELNSFLKVLEIELETPA